MSSLLRRLASILLGVFAVEVGNEAFDSDLAVDAAEAALGGDGFGSGVAGVFLVVQ